MDDDRMFSAAELAEAEARGRREALAEIAERALTAAPVNARVADLRQIEADMAAERERHAEKYAGVAPNLGSLATAGGDLAARGGSGDARAADLAQIAADLQDTAAG